MKNQEYTTVFVNPVLRQSAQGRDKQVYTAIDPKTKEIRTLSPMNKTRETGVGVELSFPIDYSRNRVVTGLDEMIQNPFKEMEIQRIVNTYNLNADDWKSQLEYLVNQDTISKQRYYEIIDSVAPDFYTDKLQVQSVFGMTGSTKTDGEPSFLQKFKVVFYDKPNRFTTETPRGRLAIQLAKVHPRIAKSSKEANNATHLFFISDTDESSASKRGKRAAIDEAIAMFFIAKKEMSPYRLYQVGSLLTNHDNIPLVKGEMSEQGVIDKISDYLHMDGPYLIENVSKFKQIMGLLDTAVGVDRFEVEYLVRQALNTNILFYSDGYFVWHSKRNEPNLYKWSSKESLISFLLEQLAIYNEDDDQLTNAYGDLYNEVSLKNVRLQ